MKYTDKVYSIDEIRNTLAPIFKQYEISRAKVFGSYAKGKAVSGDDLDLVVSTNQILNLHKYYEFVRDMHRALHIKIDVTFEEYLNPFIALDVIENSVVIYEE